MCALVEGRGTAYATPSPRGDGSQLRRRLVLALIGFLAALPARPARLRRPARGAGRTGAGNAWKHRCDVSVLLRTRPRAGRPDARPAGRRAPPNKHPHIRLVPSMRPFRYRLPESADPGPAGRVRPPSVRTHAFPILRCSTGHRMTMV